MREATSERRWLRWATRAAQVAFVPVAWWTWWCAAKWILHPSHRQMEPPRVELECAMACGCVALLWLIAPVTVGVLAEKNVRHWGSRAVLTRCVDA